MSEQIKIKEKSGYYIIELSGRFMPGGEPDVADVLRDKISEVAEKSAGGIVLDLRNVDSLHQTQLEL